jgi:hypothetical protein
VVQLVPLEGLPPFEEVILPPVALEGLRDRGLVMVAVAVTELGQAVRIPRAVQEGLEDVQAGFAREVADDLGELASHLCEGFWPGLHGLAGVGDQHLPWPEETAEYADLVVGAEGAREQAIGVQATAIM